jgi:hypothetical protein
MSNSQLTVGLIAVAIIAITGLFFPQLPSKFGQILDTMTTDYFNAKTNDGGGNYQIGGTVVHSATVLKTLTAGGTLTVTTSNTATSTAVIGCVQTYATSTATPIKELYTLAAQNVATSTNQGVNSNGYVVWAYGACP